MTPEGIKKIHKLGAKMRLLSSIFLENSLSYKMPLRFNNLDIGGGFPLLQNAPSISTTVSYKNPLLQNADCNAKEHLLQNATLFSTSSTKIHQDHHSSQINIGSRSIHSCIFMHHHAELFCLNLLGPFHCIAAALQRIA